LFSVALPSYLGAVSFRVRKKRGRERKRGEGGRGMKRRSRNCPGNHKRKKGRGKKRKEGGWGEGGTSVSPCAVAVSFVCLCSQPRSRE